MKGAATMDFFAHQDAARKATRRLGALFALAVAGIIALVYLAVATVAANGRHGPGLWQPELLLAVAAGVLLVVFLGSAFRTMQLRSGGAAVAKMLGGTAVSPSTRDPLKLRLRNVVEEMALASGMPTPEVFVLEDEDGINAFAAGWSPRDAAVAVTRGALEHFDRDELQGVIAHEFSHLFHGDVRLNTRLIGLLFGITCLVTIGEILLRSMRHTRSRGNDKNPAAALAILGLVLMVTGSLGALFAGLIKAAMSRQREYLADASAVAYTRNPHGIGRALWRIQQQGAAVRRPGARQASHMLFADGFSHWLGSLGATHPPLERRIERVLPGFAASLRRGAPAESLLEAESPTAAATAAAAATPTSPSPVAAAALTGLVGQTTSTLVAATRELLAGLPLRVQAAARSAEEAPALALALMLDHAGGDRAAEQAAGSPWSGLARELALELRRLPRSAALPLVELMAPALRELAPARRRDLHDALDRLARADGQVSTFELALMHLVRQHAPVEAQRPPRRALPLLAAVRETELLLSTMAYASGEDPHAAFAKAQEELRELPPIALLPRAGCRHDDVEAAMTRLEQLSPMGKRTLLKALSAVAAADGRIAASEGELLRAFAAAWDCPVPPLWL